MYKILGVCVTCRGGTWSKPAMAAQHSRQGTEQLPFCYPMRSPWIGSLALLAPTRGFLVHHSSAVAAVGGGEARGGGAGNVMLQAFVRPTGTLCAVRGIVGRSSTGGWRQHAAVCSQRARVSSARAPSMGGGGSGSGGGGGGGGGRGGVKGKKAKKPDSYYKNTVMLPQTAFEQVCAVCFVGTACARGSFCIVLTGLN